MRAAAVDDTVARLRRNHVRNPNFRHAAGFPTWVNYYGGRAEQDTETVRVPGQVTMRVTRQQADVDAARSSGVQSGQTLAVHSGDEVNGSFWIKGDPGLTVVCSFKYDAGWGGGSVIWHVCSGEWERIVLAPWRPDRDRSVALQFTWGAPAGARFWVDSPLLTVNDPDRHYVDGDLPAAAWSGTPGQSLSGGFRYAGLPWGRPNLVDNPYAQQRTPNRWFENRYGADGGTVWVTGMVDGPGGITTCMRRTSTNATPGAPGGRGTGHAGNPDLATRASNAAPIQGGHTYLLQVTARSTGTGGRWRTWWATYRADGTRIGTSAAAYVPVTGEWGTVRRVFTAPPDAAYFSAATVTDGTTLVAGDTMDVTALNLVDVTDLDPDTIPGADVPGWVWGEYGDTPRSFDLRNLVDNPLALQRVGDPAWWLPDDRGNATWSWVTGAADGPGGVRSYLRRAAAADGYAGGAGAGGPNAPTVGVRLRDTATAYPVTPGHTYVLQVSVRVGWAAGTLALIAQRSESYLATATVDNPEPGQWVALRVAFTMPPGADRFTGRVQDLSFLSTPVAAGQAMDVTALSLVDVTGIDPADLPPAVPGQAW